MQLDLRYHESLSTSVGLHMPHNCLTETHGMFILAANSSRAGTYGNCQRRKPHQGSAREGVRGHL